METKRTPHSCPRQPYRQVSALVLVVVALLMGGCVAPVADVRTWPGGPVGGKVLVTDHYALHTTLSDKELALRVADTMERAHRQYRRLIPTPDAEKGERLDGYVFALRDEWVEHTQKTTGSAAAVYLQIGRGGYAHARSFATFYHGTPQTLAVCRHEGWHQYVATHFEQRPPPFLEEGLSTLFEFGFDQDDITMPRMNMGRLNRLREAVRRQRVWSLEKLLTMHAGHVVGSDGREIDTFYAQAWALAMFLAEQHPKGLQTLLAAYAAGEVRAEPSDALAKYLAVSFDELSRQYEGYVRQLVYVP